MSKSPVMSDWQALSLLLEKGAENLDIYLVYKACTSFAINGDQHAGESFLTTEYIQLLDARRLLKQTQFEAVEMLLNIDFNLSKEHPRFHELSGDREFVLAMLAHRRNNSKLSEILFKKAASTHAQGQDSHRALRSLINSRIVTADLKSHISGEVFFLKQKAIANQFFDLAGNIEKSSASEWLSHGNYIEAEAAARAAVECYSKDGCPEDRSLSLALQAISLFLSGKKAEAKEARSRILITDGKLQSYVAVIDSLFAEKAPVIPEGHPLASVKWKITNKPKENSVPGRIIQKLSNTPMDRDQLIREIWGESALDPSYCGRLYTAIKDLRHKYGVSVEFDGQEYRISS